MGTRYIYIIIFLHQATEEGTQTNILFCKYTFLKNAVTITIYNIYKKYSIYISLAFSKFFRCARTSIPNMEIINKKYLMKTKNSKIIIFMRGGILSFSTNKG